MDEAPPSSLAARLHEMVRGALARVPEIRPHKRDWRIASGVAALIATGPLATIIGADLLAGGVGRQVQQLREQAAPRAAAAQAAAKERAALVALLREPGVGASVEALARSLPADASLIRVERNPAGLLEVDLTAPDPDRLRAALHREPALARLRDTGQQQGETTMIISLREAPQ